MPSYTNKPFNSGGKQDLSESKRTFNLKSSPPAVLVVGGGLEYYKTDKGTK